MRLALAVCLWAALAVDPAGGQQPGQPVFSGFIFGDVGFLATDDDRTGGFVMGQLVGHGNASLSDHLAFFGEVSASARRDGYAVEVERAILRYDFSDRVKLSAGRYHTPISFWNTAYHHGLWLQTSVARPEMIRFGSNFLPVHFVGLLLEGGLPASGLGLGYQAGVGNGRGDIISRAGDAGDVNGQRAWIFSTFAQPAVLGGARIGGSLYLDRVSRGGGVAVDERILSAHAAWERGRPELIVEVAEVHHDGGPLSASEDSRGFYAHGGYTLGDGSRTFTPYVRVEWLDVAESDLVFDQLIGDYETVLGGVRFDFDVLGALKAEVRREMFDEGRTATSLYLQASFAIPGIAGGAP